VFIGSIALFLAAILLFAGFLTSSLVMAQQTTTTGPGTTTTPLLPPPSSSSGTTLTTSSSTPPLTPQEQEQLNRLQNVIAATNLNLDETEKQIGGIVYTPRWSEPVWVEPDSSAVLVAYCLPGEFAESGQEILGGGVGFELEVLESYEVALPQNFMAWMMVIGNEDRQNRYPAAVGVICASDANDAETRVVSPEEQQQINNVVQQFSTTTSIDQVINIINRNNATTTTPPQNGNTTTTPTTPPLPGGAPPPGGTDTIAPSLSVPVDRLNPTIAGQYVSYDVSATDNVDGTARLDENNMLIQEDNVGGIVTISCDPDSKTILPIGDTTVQCSATDAAGNRGTASFIVAVVPTTTPPSAPSSGGITASLSANPATYNGPCPVTIEFTGTITDNVGNRDVTLRFYYTGNPGGYTSDYVIHFDQPGSQTVSTTGTRPEINDPNPFEGLVAIEILQPVQLQSNRAEYKITCVPNTGATQTLQAENDTTTATTIEEDEEEEEDTTTDGAGAGGDTGGGGTDDGGGESPAGTTGEPAAPSEEEAATSPPANEGGG
jgi:hypothetical protein